jgi:hypothetical protein
MTPEVALYTQSRTGEMSEFPQSEPSFLRFQSRTDKKATELWKNRDKPEASRSEQENCRGFQPETHLARGPASHAASEVGRGGASGAGERHAPSGGRG